MTRYFKINGMDCAEEVAVLKRELGPPVGDDQLLKIDVLNGRMGVSLPESRLSTADIIQAVSRTGMSAEPWRDVAADKNVPASWWERYGRTTLTIASGVLSLVRPGERIPLDGTVARGNSDVNQASTTGESMPVGVIHQNIFASLAVKVLFVGLTLAGFASLWSAIAAEAGVSLLVVLNGLRLLGSRAA